MKKFLRTHLLFPEYLGLAPYFWLLFLLPVFSLIGELTGSERYFWYGLLFFYTKVYRDSFMTAKNFCLRVVVQLVIDLIFVWRFNYIYLFIFTSFLIGSFPLAKVQFRRLLGLFYIFLALGLGIVFYGLWAVKTNIDIFDLVLMILAPAMPVLASRSLGEKQEQKRNLQNENQRLRLLAAERDRIAQALHDDLGQSFSLLALKAELAQKLLEIDPVKTQIQLEQIATEARKNLDIVRQIVHDLKYETLGQILDETSDKLKQAEIKLIVENAENVVLWEVEIQQTIAAVINEAVTNTIRYSQASFFKISFAEDALNYRVILKDNGIGFDTRQASFGITGIKQRVTKIGGTSTFTTENGTLITLVFPKQKGLVTK